MLRDLSLSAVVAGFVAVLVGYTSSVVIVYQAAAAIGADAAQTVSWLWAMGIGMAVTSIGLSLRYREPVLTAWSTPGAALLVTAGAGAGMPHAVGAFLVCAALIVLAGVTGWFERAMARIPQGLSAALLAGVLARFAIDAFAALPGDMLLVLPMLIAYLAGRRWWPRYAVPGVLAAGIAITAAQQRLQLERIELSVAEPVFTMPAFSLAAIVGIALLAPIGAGLSVAMHDERSREAALITFLVTLSGLSLAGVGAAFWGIVAGALAMALKGARAV
jgi:benzoate membrane transport protein